MEESKKQKMPKYNIKYKNNKGDVIFEDNFYKLKDCIEPLQRVCPIMNTRRLNLIREKNTTDKLAPYIIITKLEKPLTKQS